MSFNGIHDGWVGWGIPGSDLTIIHERSNASHAPSKVPLLAKFSWGLESEYSNAAAASLCRSCTIALSIVLFDCPLYASLRARYFAAGSAS